MTNDTSRTISDPLSAIRILGAWFVGRMMEDQWTFGLRMVDGSTIVITHIKAVTIAANGSIWLDVELVDRESWPSASARGFIEAAHDRKAGATHPVGFVQAMCERRSATINAAHVIMAYELSDT